MKLWPTLRHILVGEAVVLDEAGNVLCMQGVISRYHDSHVGGLLGLRRIERVVGAVDGERNRGYGIGEALLDEGGLSGLGKNLPGG